jgi:hypothetical protein
LDSEANRKKGNANPGIDRLYRRFVKPELGNFRIALVYDNKTGHCIRVWNSYGGEESTDKYNRT